MESAILQRGELWIEHEGVIGVVGHRHSVVGDGGEVGDERAKALDGQTIVGTLGGGLSIGGMGALRLGDDCRAGGVGSMLVVIVEQDGLESLGLVPLEIIGVRAQQVVGTEQVANDTLDEK